MLDLAALGVDLLADRLQSIGARESETVHRTLQVLLNLPSHRRQMAGTQTVGEGLWPSQTDVARLLEVTRARVGQILGKLQDRWARDPAITQLRTDMVDIVAGQGGVMTVPEMVEAVLLARGSSQEDPRAHATRLRRGPCRGGSGTLDERTAARGPLRRRGAVSVHPVRPARRLGRLCPPPGRGGRPTGRRRPPGGPGPRRGTAAGGPGRRPRSTLSDARLVRLASAVSSTLPISSRQELYPRGMPAARAVRLSHGALNGLRMLTVAQVQERVAGRYPEAAPLPDRPAAR